jgi:hypothetical protein
MDHHPQKWDTPLPIDHLPFGVISPYGGEICPHIPTFVDCLWADGEF